MKKVLLYLFLLISLSSHAQVKLADFDDLPIGTKWTMWGAFGGVGSSTATIEADPTNKNNHVLHIKLKDWNTFPEFVVPDELAGFAVLSKCNNVRFRLYRSNSETDDYKQMHVYYGSDQIYADNSYPYQGDKGTWQNRQYSIANIPESNTSNKLRLGIHHNNSDYYIDDVALYGPYDDFVCVPSGLVDICKKNTSSSYAVYTTPTMVNEGEKLDIRTSRYTDFNAPFAGTGTLNIYAGGERTFLGEHSNKKYPDWNLFTGDVHVYPYKSVDGSAGFYGIVMAHNGKTFSPEDVEGCLSEGKVCTTLGSNRVFLHDGAAIAFENGTRAARYGELNTDANSRIYGYYKASSAGSYLIVGNLNTDATLAGRIAPMESNGVPLNTQLLGIIKEGKGTYRITANNNVIPAGVRVLDGKLLINNDADKAQKSKLSGGTGSPATSTAAAAYVYGNGLLGGTGNIAGNVDCYGSIEPGDKSVGTLRIIDYAKNNPASLILHPKSTLKFKLKSSDEYDRLIIKNNINYSNICQDFSTSADMPRIKVRLTDNSSLSVGDEFVLVTAGARLKSEEWMFDVFFPSRYTWAIEERKLDDGSYALVAIVTSLEDNPDYRETDDDEEDIEDDDTTTYGDDGDTHTLRYYADKMNMKIGVAVSSYIDLNNTNDSRTRIIREQFNMVVPENCMKFESIEPSRNSFSYGAADQLVNFARNNKMYVRGHTLAWHSQLAQWVSVDGKKNDKGWTKTELMAILKNHITNVVTHFKGKIGEWDVVNECLDDDQSIVRTNPDGYLLRQQSVFTSVCGEEFIDSAFVWAHRADPNVKLFLNDYDNEIMGSAKAQAFYNLVRRLQKSGIPIDGVGLQCHFDAGKVDHKAMAKNIERYKELNLECIVTELDLGVDNLKETSLQRQARDYHAILDNALTHPNCKSVMVWGVSDEMSWRSSNPLMWNSSLTAKPAYYAAKDALRSYVATSIEQPAPDTNSSASPVVSVEWFSLDGIRMHSPKGICIRRTITADGSVHTDKIIKK